MLNCLSVKSAKSDTLSYGQHIISFTVLIYLAIPVVLNLRNTLKQANRTLDILNKDLPDVMVERLRHYFLTYKLIPGEKSKVRIDEIYNREHAIKVVEASILDYEDEYGT